MPQVGGIPGPSKIADCIGFAYQYSKPLYLVLMYPPIPSPLYLLCFNYSTIPFQSEWEVNLSRGCFCYDRFDWSARFRKVGNGKVFFTSSFHNLEKPERCRPHSYCVRLYHGILRDSRLWLVQHCFEGPRALPLLRRKESLSMFPAVVSFPFCPGIPCSRECPDVNR